MIRPVASLVRRSLPLRRFAQTAAASPPPPPSSPRAAPAAAPPPAAVFGLDGTYATALYTAASKTSSLEPTARAVGALAGLLARDARLGRVLAAPALTGADRNAVVAELQKHTGAGTGTGTGTGTSAAAATVGGLLAALAENNRLSLLGGVCAKFNALMSAARGEVDLVVTSAAPLDARLLSRLEAAAAKSVHVGPGKKLKVSNPVDPDIVGGLVVEIGDRTIDLSVASRMAKMNKLLTDTL